MIYLLSSWKLLYLLKKNEETINKMKYFIHSVLETINFEKDLNDLIYI